MNFILGFLASILFICIFSATIHFFRWIEGTFYSTIISVETNKDWD